MMNVLEQVQETLSQLIGLASMPTLTPPTDSGGGW